jgi:cyanophycinase-like exopeptidase
MRLALIGGEEFADGFEAAHAEMIPTGSNGVFLVTAAAEDGINTVNYWRDLAVQRLSAGGATVTAPLVISRDHADALDNVAAVDAADWIYLGGGKPHIAMQILIGTRLLDAIITAAGQGRLILGASAGAMIMCTRSFVLTAAALAAFQQQLEQRQPSEPFPVLPPLDCLNFVPDSVCLPHFNRSYARQAFRPDSFDGALRVVGIDEQTALTNVDGAWRVIGNGAVSIMHHHQQQSYRHGDIVPL